VNTPNVPALDAAGPNPYERDILDIGPSLARLLDAPRPHLGTDTLAGVSGVVLTGMGSSHYAALPSWRRLIALRPSWWVPTSEVLDSPDLIGNDTLVWITSQSGRSGEVVELLERLRAAQGPVRLLATTNDPSSPLAEAADLVVPLVAGSEATVSTKSYVNSLAANGLAVSALAGDDVDSVRADLGDVVDALAELTRFTDQYTALADHAVREGSPRLALVGFGAQAATALTGALVLKEAAKIPAEGFAGGAFRHGPLELAGPGLTVLMFPTGGEEDDSLDRLVADLADSGTNVVTVGPDAVPGTEHIRTPAGSAIVRLCTGIVPVYHLSVAIARATGVEPGAFTIGQKVTSSR